MAATDATLLERRDRRFGLKRALPSLIALFLVIVFPILSAGYTSLYDYTLISPGYDFFVGLENYVKALADPEFRHSMALTAFFVLAVVVLEFTLGFLVALMLNEVKHGKPIYYAILLCPLLMNPVIVGLIWQIGRAHV